MSVEKRLKVAFFLNTSVRGGVEEQMLTLANGLDRARFEVSLVCPKDLLGMLESDLAHDVTTRDVTVRHWSDVSSVRRLASHFKDLAPDIVHSHLFLASMFGSTIAKITGVPLTVETCHVAEVWRTSWLKKSCLVDRYFSRYVDHFIAVSHAMQRYLVRAKKIQGGKITVVWNGRDLRAFSVTRRGDFELDNPDGKLVVGVVGRLEPQKGHTHLIQAIPTILQQCPNAIFAFLGDGQLRSSLEEQCRRVGVTGAVRFLGYRRDVVGFLGSIDLFVLPSLFEGLPLAVIEASAAGLPIVATAVDGTPEVVIDGETGYLVPPAESEALGKSIVELLQNPARRKLLGSAAAKRAREHFDLAAQISATEKVYVHLSRHDVTSGTKQIHAN